MLIRLTGLANSFGQMVAVHPLDPEIAAGDFLAILGPSGCGKTVSGARLAVGWRNGDARCLDAP
jgi:ABC-type sugar transport system ATPase subunit